MRSPAAAIAWEFRQRHRWGLLALIAYLFVLAIIKLVLLERGQRVDLDEETFALVIVTVLWLASIDAVIMLALNYKAPETVMLAILAPHVPLAYLAARFAVGRARRGDVPDWRQMFFWPRQIALHDPFPSAARAQTW